MRRLIFGTRLEREGGIQSGDGGELRKKEVEEKMEERRMDEMEEKMEECRGDRELG